ncbi:unnamed protein product [Echinostoma caproni]|uniref:Secreted protein n=1 Tax=Echinostoma caproni TaxID=27848 RepID=A0A183A1G7_9TREM|nr:unnamed protein product [Echinostoma caproni]
MRFLGHIVPLAFIIFLPLVCGKPGDPMKLNSVDQTPIHLAKTNGTTSNGVVSTEPHDSTKTVKKPHES